MEGEYADLAVLSDDYFQVEPENIQWIESVFTVLGGRVVYAGAEFKHDDPALPPASPDWSPVKRFGGGWRLSEGRSAASDVPLQAASAASAACACSSKCGMHGHSHAWLLDVPVRESSKNAFWGALGCSCFAF